MGVLRLSLLMPHTTTVSFRGGAIRPRDFRFRENWREKNVAWIVQIDNIQNSYIWKFNLNKNYYYSSSCRWSPFSFVLFLSPAINNIAFERISLCMAKTEKNFEITQTYNFTLPSIIYAAAILITFYVIIVVYLKYFPQPYLSYFHEDKYFV